MKNVLARRLNRYRRLLLAGVMALAPSLASAGTIASRVLGQFDFNHGTGNTVDAEDFTVGANVGGIAVDKSSLPNHLYIADPQDHRVLGYNSIAALLNGASADLVIGQPDFYSNTANYDVGTGLNPTSNKSLSSPRGLAVDSAGNLYVVDSGNCRVLVFPNPFVTKAATGQTAAFTADIVLGQVGNFTSKMCNGGPSPSADTLNIPYSVALDPADNLYVADFGNNRVLEFDAPITTETYRANRVFGQLGNFTTTTANNGGISKDSLNEPASIALDKNGNLYIADFGNSRILEYNTPLSVTKITGSGDTSADQVWGQGGGFTTGTTNKGGISANSLDFAKGVAVDASGDVYITDYLNHRALEYDQSANPPTNTTANRVFGQANFTSDASNRGSLIPAANSLNSPTAAALDGSGDFLIVDGANNRVLKYNAPLTTDTVADVVVGQPDFFHSQNFADDASLSNQRQIALDTSTTPNRLYAADTGNHRVLGWLNGAGFTNGQAADIVIGQPDFNSNSINGPSGLTSSSTLWNPAGVAVDSVGNLYVSDSLNNRVVEYTAPFTACGGIFPCAGGAANKVFGQADFVSHSCNRAASTPDATTMCQPQQIATDSFGNLYVADYGNNRALVFNAPLTVNPAVAGSGDTTADLVVGQGTTGVGTEFTTADCNHGSGNINNPIASSLCEPFGIAVDPSHNLYIADANAFNNRILEYNETVNATTAPANVVPNAVFGQASFTAGTCNVSNGGVPSGNTLCQPIEIAFDPAGNMLVADRGNQRVLEYITPMAATATPGSGDKSADVVWGQDGNMATSYCIGTLPSAATLCAPYGVTIDAAENVYISDSTNNRITAYLPPYPPPGLSRPAASDGLVRMPKILRFGTIRMGHRQTRLIKFASEGSAPVQIFSIEATGDFSSTNSCPPILAPGQSCNLEVSFTPLTKGVRGGSILIRDDAAGSPHSIVLMGHGQRRKGAR